MELHRRLKEVRDAIEEIVCTEGCDKGVILVDHEAATRWDEALKAKVYLNEYFSPLGAAMIALHEMTSDESQ